MGSGAGLPSREFLLRHDLEYMGHLEQQWAEAQVVGAAVVRVGHELDARRRIRASDQPRTVHLPRTRLGPAHHRPRRLDLRVAGADLGSRELHDRVHGVLVGPLAQPQHANRVVNSVELALNVAGLHTVVGRIDRRAVLDADHRVGHVAPGRTAHDLADLARRGGQDDVAGLERLNPHIAQRLRRGGAQSGGPFMYSSNDARFSSVGTSRFGIARMSSAMSRRLT